MLPCDFHTNVKPNPSTLPETHPTPNGIWKSMKMSNYIKTEKKRKVASVIKVGYTSIKNTFKEILDQWKTKSAVEKTAINSFTKPVSS